MGSYFRKTDVQFRQLCLIKSELDMFRCLPLTVCLEIFISSCATRLVWSAQDIWRWKQKNESRVRGLGYFIIWHCFRSEWCNSLLSWAWYRRAVCHCSAQAAVSNNENQKMKNLLLPQSLTNLSEVVTVTARCERKSSGWGKEERQQQMTWLMANLLQKYEKSWGLKSTMTHSPRGRDLSRPRNNEQWSQTGFNKASARPQRPRGDTHWTIWAQNHVSASSRPDEKPKGARWDLLESVCLSPTRGEHANSTFPGN